jgi:hypothetical protein
MLLRCESLEPPMSQLGLTLPSWDFCGTAALPLKPERLARPKSANMNGPAARYKTDFQDRRT